MAYGALAYPRCKMHECHQVISKAAVATSRYSGEATFFLGGLLS